MSEKLVVLSYRQLQDGASLAEHIQQAFGPGSLGIIAVSGVPGYQEARKELLELALRLNDLPEAVKDSLEDPASKYSFGWSYGKESLKAGRADTHKASFYANPIVNQPPCTEEELSRYPVFCRPNIWPSRELPQLETAFKRLGSLIVDVGKQLLHHCDAYVSGEPPAADQPGHLHRVVASSQCHKGRLLLYLPHSRSGGRDADPDKAGSAASSASGTQADGSTGEALAMPEGRRGEPGGPSDSNDETGGPSGSKDETGGAQPLWCEWHLDNGSLTGLTAAQFFRDGRPVPCPDASAGLVIRTRSGHEVKVPIPEDCVAFQVGEAMGIHSGGRLQATPHCVRAPKDQEACANVTRATFAVFMQERTIEWILIERIIGINCGLRHILGKVVEAVLWLIKN